MRNRFSLLRELSLAKEDDRYMCLQTDSRAGCICLSFVINAETCSTKYSDSISWNICCSPTDVAPVLMLTGCVRLVTSKRIYPGKQHLEPSHGLLPNPWEKKSQVEQAQYGLVSACIAGNS